MTSADFSTRSTCRLCEEDDLTLVVELTPTPPANAFVTEDNLTVEQTVFPLKVFFCNTCHHVQLLDVVNPSVLFEHYLYVSGTSPTFIKHFADYADKIVADFGGDKPHGLAVDIGSNDGTLLKEFKRHGYQVLGIDPARDIAARTTKAGIQTMPEFFSPRLAQSIRDDCGPASAITANNVFAHADDLIGIVSGVRTLLEPTGVFVFEVSYLVDVYTKILFDTIYHEHLAYHSVGPLQQFFTRHGMELFRVERHASHGGSLRGYVQHHGGEYAVDESVETLVSLERDLGLDRAATLSAFGAKINGVKEELDRLVDGFRKNNMSMAGFGAPAKATTLMYHFGIGPETIQFIVDDSPLKQGMFSPGLHIPVLSSSELYENRPDAALVLAWNFAEPIIANHQRFIDGGGQFIIPLPHPRICK